MNDPHDLPAPRRGRLKKRRCCSCCLLFLPLLALIPLAALWNSEDPVVFAEAPGLLVGPMTPLVPGPGMPKDLPIQASVNNCDVARFDGRFFVGLRTGPHHFASPKVRLLILSSLDRETWVLEHEVHMGADMREPRFLVFKGRLFFYYFEAGTDALAFEPKRIQALTRGDDGLWSAPTPVYEPGFVVWRAKVHDGTAYMSVYKGAGLYSSRGRGAEVRLLTSSDGLDWKPISEKPQVTEDGASECDFEFTDDGGLVAIVRLEVQGSLFCRAKPGDLTTWEQTYSPHKYDSPLMLRRGDTYYVIARRNVAGQFLRGPDFLPTDVQRGWSLARYSLTRKRSCIYRVDFAGRRLLPLHDLPSRGDTAFPAVAPIDDETLWFVNYSNDIEGPDIPWIVGQLGVTRLYQAELRLPGD